MRVLLIEGEPGVAEEPGALLEAGGHSVVRCHEPGAEPFPCVGLDDQRMCPVHHRDVDVALVVHDSAIAYPARAAAALCAMRARIPVVVSGASSRPYAEHAVTAASDVVAACVEAAGARSFGHEAAALAELERHLGDAAVVGGAVEVVVHRRQGGLDVQVLAPTQASAGQESAIADVVRRGLRGYDPDAQAMGISVLRRDVKCD